MLLPYDIDLSDLARELRDRQTLAEALFWKEARNRKILGYKIVRQKPILSYVVDFYCYELGLVIELDGKIHLQRKEYDTHRTNELKALDLTVVRYTNDQILKEMPRVLEHVRKIMTLLERHPSLKERGWG